MSSVIYKAMPGDTIANLEKLEGCVRFSGNDTKAINISSVEYGSTLMLEEFDSLEEINIKGSSGAVVSFTKFPEQTIRIKGHFDEVRVQEGQSHYFIHKHVICERYSLQMRIPSQAIWGAVITRDSNIKCGNMDALMIYSENLTDLHIDCELSHISVIADKFLEDINVGGKRQISKFVVYEGPSLKSLNIRRQVLECSISRCPQLQTVTGIGNKLSLDSTVPSDKDRVSINGFWLIVPGWYKSPTKQLLIGYLDNHLSYSDIVNCNDLGGSRFMSNPYNGTLHSNLFETICGEELDFGIEVPRLIELIEENPALGLAALKEWCDDNTLSFFDQYLGMRVVASLICRGFDVRDMIEIRNRLLRKNNDTPIIEQTVSNNTQRINRFRDIRREIELDDSMWVIPKSSVMPFDRIDLEIWLHTNLNSSYIGMDFNTTRKKTQLQSKYATWLNHFPSHRAYMPTHRNCVISNLLNSTLGATRSTGREDVVEKKLTLLIEEIFSNESITSDPICCQFLITHFDFTSMKDTSLPDKLIKPILAMEIESWKKSAYLFAIIEKTNSAQARFALMEVAEDVSVTESRAINAVSLLGMNAFDTGKVPRPEWPYIDNWIKTYKNGGGR
ncbi:MAG: hypothetical protein CMB32_00115 [Euryarchaeota archaeon]|mgnify:FL=1|nr:hypothetical protein [Euryarchaeota archaeon]